MENIWPAISHSLSQFIDAAQYKVWISPLKASVKEGELTLFARNDFVAKFIRSHFYDLISQSASATLGYAPKIFIKAGEPCAAERPAEKSAAETVIFETPLATVPVAKAAVARPVSGALAVSTAPAPAQVKEAQEPLPLGWAGGDLFNAAQDHRLVKSWRHDFSDFIVGPCNELAHAAAKSVCENHSGFGSVLFMCSGAGLGKTHLMQSVGSTLVRTSNFKAPRIEYLTAEEFASHLRMALRAGEVERFKARFREADVLLLEDVHFLQEKEKTQNEVLSTVTALLNRGSKVVFSSSFSPRELCKMDSQLLSRLSSGMIAAIHKPDRETRRRIITSKASAQRVTLPGDVTDYLAEAMGSDVRQIESCIQNLALKARFFNRAINMDMARETVSNYMDSVAVINLPEIIRMVCEGFGVSEDALGSKSRRQDYVQARNTAFYLARKHTSLSLQEIGQQFNRTHSTVIKGITSLEREISRQSPSGRQLAGAIDRIEKNVKMPRHNS